MLFFINLVHPFWDTRHHRTHFQGDICRENCGCVPDLFDYCRVAGYTEPVPGVLDYSVN